MADIATQNDGKYLYAIIPAVKNREYGNIGIDGEQVYLITENKIAAVVSNFSKLKIRPERRHIATHQVVLKELMQEVTPLPITFGVIADGTTAIKRILYLNQEAFSEQLRHVHGKVEMGVRVTWNVPNIFEYFVSTHTEVREARDRFFGISRVPTKEDKLEIGLIFDRTLQEGRNRYADKVETVLSRACFEIKRNAPRTEKEIMNLACLVGRNAVDKEFEAAIFEVARGFDNNFTFDFNGPWAPHNFVNMELIS